MPEKATKDCEDDRVQRLSEISCFLRHVDGRVTCFNRCTDSTNAKTVLIGYNSNCVPVLMYGSSQCALQKPPEDTKISPYNHALERKGRAQSQVKLTIRRDIAKQ